jgi:hypothetical protein
MFTHTGLHFLLLFDVDLGKELFREYYSRERRWRNN